MVAPYSNSIVVEAPLGLTVPFRVADSDDNELADLVDATGDDAEAVNVSPPPVVVPALFVAFTRK